MGNSITLSSKFENIQNCYSSSNLFPAVSLMCVCVTGDSYKNFLYCQVLKITPNWEEHKCSSTGKWILKNCGILIEWDVCHTAKKLSVIRYNNEWLNMTNMISKRTSLIICIILFQLVRVLKWEKLHC